MNQPRLPRWTDQARSLLDESVQALDGAAASRLHQARRTALAQRAPRHRHAWFHLPAGLATACALVVAVGFWYGHSTPPVVASADVDALRADDVDMLGDSDTLEMIQDLDFYAWLDAQDPDDNG